MAKLKDKEITAAHLAEYVATASDFAFERRVLSQLSDRGFACEHSGTSEHAIERDRPTAGIQATHQRGRLTVRLAIVCQHIPASFPLLVHRVPRQPVESFHEVMCAIDPTQHAFNPPPIQAPDETSPHARCARLEDSDSAYHPGEPVGKAVEQVGRTKSGFHGSSEDVYDSWTRALDAARDQASAAYHHAERAGEPCVMSAVVPTVVVPNGRLWAVDYDEAGAVSAPPRPISRCAYFVDAGCRAGGTAAGTTLTVSHVEFATPHGLDELIDELCGDGSRPSPFFPVQRIVKLVCADEDAVVPRRRISVAE